MVELRFVVLESKSSSLFSHLWGIKRGILLKNMYLKNIRVPKIAKKNIY